MQRVKVKPEPSGNGQEVVMTAWLVWLRGLRGPNAEIWRDDHIEVYRNRSEARVLSVRQLSTSEATEPIRYLAQKYPSPGNQD